MIFTKYTDICSIYYRSFKNFHFQPCTVSLEEGQERKTMKEISGTGDNGRSSTKKQLLRRGQCGEERIRQQCC